MFDLPAGTIDRPFPDKRAKPALLSMATHGVVIGAMVGAFLFTVTEQLPEVPTMLAFAAELPAPAPPRLHRRPQRPDRGEFRRRGRLGPPARQMSSHREHRRRS